AGALAVENAIAVPDERSKRVASALQSSLANTLGARAQVLVDVGVFAPSLQLIGIGELVDCDFVLVRMAGPGAVHQAVRLVLLILLEHVEGARIQLGVFPAGI